MGYLVCDDCGGYYKLLEGENAEDFESCQCHGKLTYFETLENIHNNRENNRIVDKKVTPDKYGFVGDNLDEISQDNTIGKTNLISKGVVSNFLIADNVNFIKDSMDNVGRLGMENNYRQIIEFVILLSIVFFVGLILTMNPIQ